MSPMYRMPDPVTRRREVRISEIGRALAAARCAVRVAGLGTGDPTVRELLLAAIEELNRAERALVILAARQSRDGVA